MIEVKEILDSDIDIAKDIYCESFDKEKTPTTLPLLGKVIGIYKDSELIGFCQIDYINDIFENKKRAYINSFCIKDNYRNMGYGDKLLKSSIDIIKKDNANYINMTSNKNRVIAHKLYKNNNFEVVDTIIFKKNLL